MARVSAGDGWWAAGTQRLEYSQDAKNAACCQAAFVGSQGTDGALQAVGTSAMVRRMREAMA